MAMQKHNRQIKEGVETLEIFGFQNIKNKLFLVKVVVESVHINGHTVGFHSQTK